MLVETEPRGTEMKPTLEQRTIERLKAAKLAGVNIKRLSRDSQVSTIKLQVLSSEKDYGQKHRLSDEQCERINNALDALKGAL